jgi:hypothetical protein
VIPDLILSVVENAFHDESLAPTHRLGWLLQDLAQQWIAQHLEKVNHA